MRKIIIYCTLLFQILLIVSLVRNIQMSLKAKSRVTDLEKRKNEVVQKQKKLEDQLTYVQSDYYVEKVAREELQLSKPGETVILLPQSTPSPDQKAQEKTQLDPTVNWQKWWWVLSGKM